MSEESYPFQSVSFTLIEDRLPRVAFRMALDEDGAYQMHAEKGSASNPSQQFTRKVPRETAQRLNDALKESGVFGWDESYGNAEGLAPRRWNLNIVFKEGVFTLASKGGNAVPAGFDQLLEELYRMDMPRPDGRRAASNQAARGTAGLASTLGALGLGGFGGMSAGDLGAYGAVGKGPGAMDFSQLAEMLPSGALGDLGDLGGMDALGDMGDLLGDLKRDPQALQQRMKEEFKHMSPEEQNRMLDMLASTGYASRAWWERFLRG